MSSKRSTIEYVGLGAAVYVGGLLAYNAYKAVNKNIYARTIENNTEPPPTIRTPAQGNSQYGYFGNWFYGGQTTSNHVQDL